MATAMNSFHTPLESSSRPMAIPSNRLWTDRARKTRNDRREESTDLRRDLEEISDSESLLEAMAPGSLSIKPGLSSPPAWTAGLLIGLQ